MAKNIEKLAKIGESTLKNILTEEISKIKRGLQYLSDYPKENINLRGVVNSYNQKNKEFKEKYGVEFPDLQKKYEEMLPEIRKYINIKEI